MVVLVAVAGSVAVLLARGEAPVSSDPTAGLPASAESTQVAALQQRLPNDQTNPALVVYSRDGETLTAEDEAAIASSAAGFADLASGGPVSPAVTSPDRTAALVSVPLSTTGDEDAIVSAVDEMRERLSSDLPDGLSAQVTGGAGFDTDLSRVFDGANVSLLLVTVVVVAVLLLVTYRSPFLWLVPLIVVAVGDQVAASLVTILDRATDLEVDPATEGIVSILVFGAGTNYALLIIARYREELRLVEDRFTAMRRALSSGAPAVIASAGTVALSLLTLIVADLTSNRTLGLAGALGVAVALLYAIVVLPAALVLFGRWLFWPFVPRVGSANPTRTGFWARVGGLVSRRPGRVAAASVVLLGILTAGLTSLDVGLSQTENFRERVEAIEGQEVLARAFPAGAGDPLAIVTTVADAQTVADVAAAVPGVAQATVGAATGTALTDTAQVDAVLEAAPGTDASDQAIADLRSALDEVGPDALVGGPTAITYDTALAAERDQRVIAPLVLGVVLLILVLLLRSLVAPVVLILTVIASYAAAFGAANWLFTSVFDFPAVDVSVPLLAFLFLVALGVDYNIFLTTRAREEAVVHGTRRGMTIALAVTGGVITSAGVLLAAVFAVLGVLPLILLTQLGVIVGIGVLLDTLLVRSVLVPALVDLLGRRTWWPSRLSRDRPEEHRESGDGPTGRPSPVLSAQPEAAR